MINKDDGKNVIKFITEQLGVVLPQRGLLAGQSICSVLMYLKGLSKDLVINDFDIFMPHVVGSGWNFYTQTWFDKKNLVKFNIEMNNKNIPIDSIPDVNLLVESIKNIPSCSDHSIELLKGSVFDLNSEYFSDKAIKNSFSKEKKIIFKDKYDADAYRINHVSRNGLLNYVFISGNKKDNFTPNPYMVINYFDINCVQAAIDLKTQEIYYTRHFEYFLHSKQMIILRAERPYHTIIRYFQKKEQHNYFGNDEMAAGMINTYIKLCGLNENDLLIEMEPYCSYDSFMNKKISEFGGGYRNKFELCQSIKNFYKISDRVVDVKYKNKEKVNASSWDKYNLSRLSPRDDGIDYILKGIHRNELTKRLQSRIENYPIFARNVLPSLIHEHFGVFKKKYSEKKNNIIFSESFGKRKKNHNGISRMLSYDADYFQGNINSEQQCKINEFLNKHDVGFHFLSLTADKTREIIKKLHSIENRNPELVNMLEFIGFIDFKNIPIDKIEDELKNIYIHYEIELSKRDILKEKADLPAVSIDGINILELISQAQIDDESKVLRHCVRGYGKRIKNKISYIVSFRKNHFDRATLELSYNENKKKFFIIQFRCKLNKKPSELFYTALEKYMQIVNNEVVLE